MYRIRMEFDLQDSEVWFYERGDLNCPQKRIVKTKYCVQRKKCRKKLSKLINNFNARQRLQITFSIYAGRELEFRQPVLVAR